jgi:mannose-6-phosphate isomerase-like protein (cupin superfamily)
MKIQSLGALPDEAVSHNPAIKKKVMVRAGDIPNLMYFSRACFPPGAIAGEHSHTDMSEVFFVESGTGIIRINGADYALESGSCIAVEPNEIHEVINTGADELVLTYFGIAAESPLLNHSNTPTSDSNS